MTKTDSEKATYRVAGRNTKTLTKLEISIPPSLHITSARVRGSSG